MRIARVTGTVTATVKEPSLAGTKLLVVDIEGGDALQRSLVAADTCGAGVGDLVLLTTGSAARLSTGTGTLPVDAAIIAVVDHVELARPAEETSSNKKRKR
ncbi:MAG: EutN/CcmL family microcompartment protein [Alphaproteobacteria bacterium]|nr:EutN/CcmL family microcompartment protein [Alphaproteobacteria bacterium]